MAFKAKYYGKCFNGHEVCIGDSVIWTIDDKMLCVDCVNYSTHNHKKPTIVYSNKFCDKHFLELSLTGECSVCVFK